MRGTAAVLGTSSIPGSTAVTDPCGRGRGGREVAAGPAFVTWCGHGAGAGADAGAALGRGGLSPFQAAAPDQLLGRGGDGGILPGEPGVHGRGHHGQGEGLLPFFPPVLVPPGSS